MASLRMPGHLFMFRRSRFLMFLNPCVPNDCHRLHTWRMLALLRQLVRVETAAVRLASLLRQPPQTCPSRPL